MSKIPLAGRAVLVAATFLLAGARPAAGQACATPSRDWSDADRRAVSSDGFDEQTLDALAAHLRRGARTETARLRAAYVWAAAHVAYDHTALAGRRPSPSADTVLATRRGVCEGIARLTVALAQRLGVEAVAVPGWATAPSGEAAVAPDGLHMWVAARVDGRWTLSDPTWAPGAAGPSAWFDVPPDAFVRTHLPLDPRWQLLAAPLTPDDAVARRWPAGGCMSAPAEAAGRTLDWRTTVRATAGGPPWRVEQGVRYRVVGAPATFVRNRAAEVSAEVDGAAEVALFEGTVLRTALRLAGGRWSGRIRPSLGPVVLAARMERGGPWRMLDARPVQ